MDSKITLYAIAALVAVGVGYGACALSTDEGEEAELGEVDPGNDIPTMPPMDAGTEPLAEIETDPVVDPVEPSAQVPAAPMCNGIQCDQGEACCPATGECVPADCGDCCSTDLQHPPEAPVDLVPQEPGPAGPMPVPGEIEGTPPPRPAPPNPVAQ